MNHLSLKLLAETVISRRKTMGLSQAALSKKANINRSILSRLETCDYSPSVDQLLSLSAVLGFKPTDVIVDDEAEVVAVERKRIAVAGTGYVGLLHIPAEKSEHYPYCGIFKNEHYPYCPFSPISKMNIIPTRPLIPTIKPKITIYSSLKPLQTTCCGYPH